MFNLKNTSKLVLLACVITGTFYCASVLAYSPITANAGSDQYLNGDTYSMAIVTALHGSAKDPNLGILTFHWSCNGGYIANPDITSPNFTVPNTTQKISYTCTLKVTDSYGISDTDDVVIFINSDIGFNNPGAQTLPTTNILNGRATLNGSFYVNYTYNANYKYWFEWGTGTLYNAQTTHQPIVSSWLSLSGYKINQDVASLTPNTLYHFRVAVQEDGKSKVYYGKDMTFYNGMAGVATGTTTPNIVLAGGVYNSPTAINTGLTNDFLKDSFFLPLVMLVMGFWIFVFAYKKKKA